MDVDLYNNPEFIRWRDYARWYRGNLIAAQTKLSTKVRVSARREDCCEICKAMHGKVYEFQDAFIWDILPNIECLKYKAGARCCAEWSTYLPSVDG